MTEAEIRLACLDLSLRVNCETQGVHERAEIFVKFVGSDELRLGCLRLAVQAYGSIAWKKSEPLLDHAQGYLDFVSPAPPKPTVPKRGRSRKY